MINALRQFNKTIWLIILSTFAGRFILFMVWPFLAIILYQKYSLNAFQIGAFLAGSTGVGVVFGFYVGFLSDKVGRRKIILVGIVLTIIAMSILGTADSLGWLFTGTILQSLARSMTENPGRALMTDMVDTREVRDMALQVRYFALNVGAAFGPMLGASIGLAGKQSTFLLLAAVSIAYLVAASIIFQIERPLKRTAMAADLSLKQVINVLRKDRAFMLFVMATLLCDITYGQIDSSMVQYLRQANVVELTQLYATLILINGSTIILFQFPLLKLLARFSPFLRAMSGVALFAAGFLGFALAPTDTGYALIVAMFVLSVGEVILFPTLSIIIDRMAPDHLKGSYFGTASLATFGFVLAPLIGGWLLFEFGGQVLWLTMTLISSLVAGLYLVANRDRARTD